VPSPESVRPEVPRPYRRWPRRVLVAANLGCALLLVAVGLAWGYARWRLDSVHAVAAPHLTAQGNGSHNSENILIIGNETRLGLTNPQEIQAFGSPGTYNGELSDVIMILHLNLATKQASLLSIPRDLFVAMPPGSPVGPYQKIDAALNDGTNGPDNLIEAITDDLGIPINHYVEFRFDGFEQVVNAIGGISVDFPMPLYDQYSNLDIATAGCQHLNGSQALALVRSRELQYDPPGVPVVDKADWPHDPESDLARIDRDHTLIRILVSAAKSEGLSNPIKANNFIGAVIGDMTIDPGFRSQLISLAADFKNIDSTSAPETTLPINVVANYRYNGVDMGDVDFAVQPTDDQVISAWDRSALPAPAAPTSIQVDNMTTTSHLAANTANELTAKGFNVSGTTTLTDPAGTSETLVRYSPGQLAQGVDVLDHLEGAVVLESDSTVPPGTVNVDLGSTAAVAGTPAATAPATTVTPSTTATPSSPAPATTTVIPTPGGQAPSASNDRLQPWDPRPCPSKP
jgi:LCP family protein required for cell wall assembly